MTDIAHDTRPGHPSPPLVVADKQLPRPLSFPVPCAGVDPMSVFGFGTTVAQTHNAVQGHLGLLPSHPPQHPHPHLHTPTHTPAHPQAHPHPPTHTQAPAPLRARGDPPPPVPPIPPLDPHFRAQKNEIYRRKKMMATCSPSQLSSSFLHPPIATTRSVVCRHCLPQVDVVC